VVVDAEVKENGGHSSKCTENCAQKSFDRADIVRDVRLQCSFLNRALAAYQMHTQACKDLFSFRGFRARDGQGQQHYFPCSGFN
jgi:hypothetical protein